MKTAPLLVCQTERTCLKNEGGFCPTRPMLSSRAEKFYLNAKARRFKDAKATLSERRTELLTVIFPTRLFAPLPLGVFALIESP